MSHKNYGISKEIDIAAQTNDEQTCVTSTLENPGKLDAEENTEGDGRMRNNKIYFGGKIRRGTGIGQVVGGLLSNVVKGVLGGI